MTYDMGPTSCERVHHEFVSNYEIEYYSALVNLVEDKTLVNTSNGEKVVKTLCRMCDDHCGINVHLKDGKIVDTTGNANHPFNKGAICIKGKAIKDLVYTKDRILKPLKKVNDGWQEISLEQALDEIAERIVSIKNEFGAKSIGVWKGEAVGFQQQEEIVRRFAHAFGTPNYFSNDSACFAGRWIGYSLVCGRWPKPDFENSKCILLWGRNPVASRVNLNLHRSI